MALKKLIYLDKERIRLRGDEPMGGSEKLDEAEWLRDGGLHQLVVARQLGSTWESLGKLAYRHGRVDLGGWFSVMKYQKRYAS